MLYRDKRLLVLSAMLLCIAGFASFRSLPNSEDPSLAQRFGSVTTRLPGADAERVDALITAKIEDALLSIEEVHTLKSTSRAGLSLIDVELEEWVGAGQIDQAWTRVRSKVEEVRPMLPRKASIPIIDDDLAGAMSFIAAVVWKADSEPLLSILQRYAKELEDLLVLVPNTEKSVMFGEVEEEIQVTIDPRTLGSLGLTTSQIARAIADRDSREPAGRLRAETVELGIEVEGAIESLDRLSELSVVVGDDSQAVKLQDIASIEKGVADPPKELVIIDGKRGIAVSSRMKVGARTEIWTQRVLDRLHEFEQRLPPTMGLEIPFQQSVYTIKRLKSLRTSLLLAVISVVAVNFILMGWRSSLIVSLSIPATILFALILMNLMGVAIHQMSVVGFIVALGMLIDNAIIMVDEIRQRGIDRDSHEASVQASIGRLAIPLLASTMTSVLAFMPIALMPGGTGEFMRAMALTVIACLIASYALAITLVPALMGHLQAWGEQRDSDDEHRNRFWYRGFSSPWLSDRYSQLLTIAFHNPRRVIGLIVMISGIGVFLGLQQQQEIFPMSDRDQFNIRLELPLTASIEATAGTVTAASERILEHPEVTGIHWFVGTGAPVFYYNLTSFTAAAANSAEALVEVNDATKIVDTIRDVQRMLDREYSQCQSIVRQLGQGEMPLAPIELSIKGPDILRLSEFSEQLRSRLIATEGVVHTRSTLKDGQTKLMLAIDEPHAFRAQLTNDRVAEQLSEAIEGAIGGSMLEDTEELPIRVRFNRDARASVDRLRSIELISEATSGQQRLAPAWLPLDAIGTLRLVPELSEIHRLDGQRSATVQGFLTAGTLPAKVFSEFQDELDQFTQELPGGYSVKVAGDAEVHGDALVSLMAYMGVVLTLMLAVLVISLKTFRGTAIIIAVAVLSIGFGLGALWVGQFNFGFSAILGVVGLIGVSINDSIVVLTGIMGDDRAARGEREAVQRVVMRDTRHVIATSVTTMAGFVPLMFGVSSIWPPLAVVVGFGVGGATLIALFFTPAVYLVLMSKPSPSHRRGG